jgi:hypothetical protein
MTDAKMPADPMTVTREGWVALHEMFKGARGGGFGLLEAALMVASMVVTQGLKPPEA